MKAKIGDAFDFSDIVYRKPLASISSRGLSNLVGFDSEAYKSGRPFLYSTSRGDCWGFSDLPHVFFRRAYRNTNFIVWNLKYDSGAVLYHLPLRQMESLRVNQRCSWRGVSYRYFPHKFLRLTKGKNSVTFWDVMPVYHSRLEDAAQKYLGEGKVKFESMSFSPEFVERNLPKIKARCLKDADLTHRLCLHFLRELEKFDIRPSSLYSLGSVSFTYFKSHTDYVDVWRFWEDHRHLLRLACEAYAGGKFEVTQRGAFEGYLYDIDSAYPFEIARLLDISKAKVKYGDSYDAKASYGFYRCLLDVPDTLSHPVPKKRGTVNLFPVGTFRATITKDEYDYLKASGARVKIFEGYNLYCRGESYPYREAIQELWSIKSSPRYKDTFMRDVAKLLMNSIYGKMVQLIREPSGALRAGPGWNPIYGAIITARTRIRMSQGQQELGASCLAVHTDALITTRKIPREWLGSEMGDYILKDKGEGVIIASGLYEVGKHVADRGFKVDKGFRWHDLLAEMGSRSLVRIPEKRALSWVGAIHQDRPEDINRFLKVHKVLDVNCDTKRVWLRRASARSLLRGLENSIPPVYLA